MFRVTLTQSGHVCFDIHVSRQPIAEPLRPDVIHLRLGVVRLIPALAHFLHELIITPHKVSQARVEEFDVTFAEHISITVTISVRLLAALLRTSHKAEHTRQLTVFSDEVFAA